MTRKLSLSLTDVIAAAIVVAVLYGFGDGTFTDLESEQRSVAIEGFAGSLRSGAALAHAIWVDDGTNLNTVELSNTRLVEIDPLTGYPSATAAGLLALVPETRNFVGTNKGPVFVFTITGGSHWTCSVTYATGALAGEPPKVRVRNNRTGGDCG